MEALKEVGALYTLTDVAFEDEVAQLEPDALAPAHGGLSARGNVGSHVTCTRSRDPCRTAFPGHNGPHTVAFSMHMPFRGKAYGLRVKNA